MLHVRILGYFGVLTLIIMITLCNPQSMIPQPNLFFLYAITETDFLGKL
jgi:hypothetical protein